MVGSSYAVAEAARNVAWADSSGATQVLGSMTEPVAEEGTSRADVRTRLLAAFGLDGKATVDALVRAIPEHASPLSAIMSLVDIGWLEMDGVRAFDASTEFRRVAPRAA